jgi:hypothetical protein
MPIEMWSPWRTRENEPEGSLADVRRAVENMLRPEVVLDILQSFTLFATDKKHRRIKVICRYQQYFTTNQLIERVVKGYPKKGLIWHFQGSGKSLLMVFAAQKLRLHPQLGNPTVIIVVDRIDLDTQITATFNAADVANMVGVATRQELQMLLGQDVRKVLITTIHKFGESGGKLNERSNIIVMVDEAHRTQEGDLGRKMREALPNAFLFGLTGTPINRADKNTFWAFGADEDNHGYMSRYSFQESIRDKATLPLHFEAPEVKLKINKAAIDEAYRAITGDLSEQDRDDHPCERHRADGPGRGHRSSSRPPGRWCRSFPRSVRPASSPRTAPRRTPRMLVSPVVSRAVSVSGLVTSTTTMAAPDSRIETQTVAVSIRTMSSTTERSPIAPPRRVVGRPLLMRAGYASSLLRMAVVSALVASVSRRVSPRSNSGECSTSTTDRKVSSYRACAPSLNSSARMMPT